MLKDTFVINTDNKKFISVLETLIDTLNIKSILHIHSGNFKYISIINLTDIIYTKININNIQDDSLITNMPNVDLIIMKDAITNLSDELIVEILDKYTKKCKVLLLSDSDSKLVNMDKYPYDKFPTTLIDTDKNEKIYVYPEIKIPKIIHFMWYSQDSSHYNSIPDNYKKYVKTWAENNKDYKIIIWTVENIQKEILQTDIFKKYKKTFDIMHHIEKCDLLRYIILYMYGGIYSDLNNLCNQNISRLLINRTLGLSFEPMEHNIIVFNNTKQELITNSFLISSKRNKFWIDFLNFINNFYFKNRDNSYVLINTGPYILGKFVLNYFKYIKDIIIKNCYTQIYINENENIITTGCENHKNNVFFKVWKDTSHWGGKYNNIYYDQFNVKQNHSIEYFTQSNNKNINQSKKYTKILLYLILLVLFIIFIILIL